VTKQECVGSIGGRAVYTIADTLLLSVWNKNKSTSAQAAAAHTAQLTGKPDAPTSPTSSASSVSKYKHLLDLIDFNKE
jgi:hypothetical protein